MDCSDHRWTPRGFADWCKTCKAPLERLDQPKVSTAEPGPAAYLGRVREFLSFPFQRSVLVMLGGLAVFVAPLAWAVAHNIIPGVSAYGRIVIVGLEASIYFHFVTSTGYGKQTIEPPDFSDPGESLFEPATRYFAALVPLLLSLIWLGLELGSITDALALSAAKDPLVVLLDHPGPMAAILLSLLLLPILTVIAAVAGSAFTVLDPRVWIQSLRTVGATYFVATALFFTVLGLEIFVLGPVLLTIRADYSIPVLTSVVTLFISYLPMAFRARLLGGLIEPYFQDLQ